MAVFDKDPNLITPEEAYDLVGDRAPGFHVSFYEEDQPDDVASRAAKRPIMVKRLCVRFKVNGDRYTQPCRVATEIDKRRWSEQYALFVQQKDIVEKHTPIQAMRPASTAAVGALIELGCKSVQQLAEAPEFDHADDWDLALMRDAAIQIATILENTKHAIETEQANHASAEEIAAQAHAERDAESERGHQIKVDAFAAQLRREAAENSGDQPTAREIAAYKAGIAAAQNHHGTDGKDHAELALSGHGSGAGGGGQVDRSTDAVRPGESQGDGGQGHGAGVNPQLPYKLNW